MTSPTRSVLRALIALLLPAALAGQAVAPEEYAARRDSLAARLGNGVVVAFGAPSPTGVNRQAQLPAFRWLTGFLEPDAALVLMLRGGHATGILFTQPRDPRRVLYDGFPPDSAAVARATGLGARSIAALAPTLDSLAGTGQTFFTLRDYAGDDYADTDSLTRGAVFMRGFAERHRGPADPERAPRDGQPPRTQEPGRAGAASPCDRGHRGRAARGHAHGAPGHVGIRDRGPVRLRVPEDRWRWAGLRLHRRIRSELDAVPLRGEQPADARGRRRA